MKKLALIGLIAIGLTSCSKDSLDQSTDPASTIRKSEILVSASYLHWNDQCETGCNGNGNESLAYIINATVDLYHGEMSLTDALGTPMASMRTDQAGSALMEDLDPATYTIVIDTPLGKKSRNVNTQLHRRTYVDFSF